MGTGRAWNRALIAALLSTVWPAAAAAIDVAQPLVWGYDGRIAFNRFNPLSALIQNNTAEAWDGNVFLEKVTGAAIFESIVEPVYVAPFSSRWVQFYPLVKEYRDSWRLRLRPRDGGRTEYFEIPEPKVGRPATVFLSPGDRLGPALSGLHRLPENLFPPLVTATDGLRGLVLAHSPQWDEPRQQACLDWIRRGGELHILNDLRGRSPVFAGLLKPLNEANGVFGAGRVVRHSKTPTEIDAETLKAMLVEPAPPDDSDSQKPPYSQDRQGSRSIDEGLVRHLKDMTRADHNWALIFFLALAYLLVFPAVYLLGRRRLHFGIVYGTLLGAVALFSLAFHQVGKRGYGESTTVHSISLARPIETGVYDVTQWSHVFVTDGGDYHLKHDAASLLYSTARSYEAIRGTIKNGAGAEFLVDIPPFSGRDVVGRLKTAGPKLSAKLLALQGREPEAANPDHPHPTVAAPADSGAFAVPVVSELSRLEIEFEGDVSVVRTPVRALYRNVIYNLHQGTARVWTLTGAEGNAVLFFQSNDFEHYGAYEWRYRRHDMPEQLFEQMYRPVMQASLVARPDELAAYSHPADRVRVFFIADAPATFLMDSRALGRQSGKVVYAFDVSVQPSADSDQPPNP